MDFIRKWRTEIILALLIVVAYFVSRIILLGNLPIFTDEAIYTRWAQIALNDPQWRFISLTDGKQPMLVWVAMILMKFIEDPLLAARLTSVASGFFTLIGLWFLTRELFKSTKVAFLTSFLYVVYPFAIVLDRMAIYDSMVAAFFVWALYFSILLIRRTRLDIAYTLGLVIAGGMMTKTANFFSVYLLPFLLVLFNFRKKNWQPDLIRFALLTAFSVILAFFLYNILRLSPFFHIIDQKNAVFVYPFSEWIKHPFTFFQGNLLGLLSWLYEYLKVPFIVLILISLLRYKDFTREKLLLLVYFSAPFVALALFGKVIFPRFIFFMSLMLLPLASLGLSYVTEYVIKKYKVSRSLAFVIVTTIFIAYPALVSLQFIYDPVNSRIATADNRQYINSWAGGWGVKESVEYFRNEAKDKKIYVATAGTFGLLPAALEIYLVENKNIEIKGYWPVDVLPKEVLRKAEDMPTFLITYQRENEGLEQKGNLKLVFQIRQGNTEYFYKVFRAEP